MLQHLYAEHHGHALIFEGKRGDIPNHPAGAGRVLGLGESHGFPPGVRAQEWKAGETLSKIRRDETFAAPCVQHKGRPPWVLGSAGKFCQGFLQEKLDFSVKAA